VVNEINGILSGFSPIGLEEIGKVAFMDRMDTKFVFPASRLPEILNELSPGYRVLEVNSIRASRYETVYYDTPDFFHFQQHHSGHLMRYKVRTRCYLETKDSFVEIKFKTNHGRTIKHRIAVQDCREEITGKVRSFVGTKTNNEGSLLEPKMHIRFSRITLIDRGKTERVTLDFGLAYSNETQNHSFDPLIIAEVKQGCRSFSPFIRLMRKKKIRRFTISKYCLGVMSLYSHVKHNRFKPKLRYLNLMTHAANGNN
jgi:hypothetical protein